MQTVEHALTDLHACLYDYVTKLKAACDTDNLAKVVEVLEGSNKLVLRRLQEIHPELIAKLEGRFKRMENMLRRGIKKASRKILTCLLR